MPEPDGYVIDAPGRRVVVGELPKRKPPKPKKSLKYVIVRASSAGVFAGELESLTGTVAVLVNARRLWFWSGAASLSQMAVDGTSKPQACKFPAVVPRVTLLQAFEIIEVTDRARASIEGVPVWQQ